jgi:hypothetical protein
MNDHSETVIDITIPSVQLGDAAQPAEVQYREGIYDGYWRDRQTVAEKDAERADAGARAASALALEAAARAAASAARWAMGAALAAAFATLLALILVVVR